MFPLKQSTAHTLLVYVQDASGLAVTGLVDGGFTKRISKNGGTFAAMTVTITEMERGWYSCPLTSTHTDTLGELVIVLVPATGLQANVLLRVHARIFDDIANSAGSIPAQAFAADTDIYQAKAWLDKDGTGTTDRYIVTWFKNGQPVTSGITSPTIQVIKSSDGSDLIASTAMTQIASTGYYKYDATTTARITVGAGYVIKTVATIDGASRSSMQPMSRDS